jgi:hypothetical protein
MARPLVKLEMHIIFGVKTLMEGETWGDKDVNVKMILKRIFEKQSVKVWTGLSWLKTI